VDPPRVDTGELAEEAQGVECGRRAGAAEGIHGGLGARYDVGRRGDALRLGTSRLRAAGR